MRQRHLATAIAATLTTVLVGGCSVLDATTEPTATVDPSISTVDDSQAGPVDNSGRPVVTQDGRMLQPKGHEGIWFETEPDDPWEKYIWRSQQFVGDPVELPPLEGEFYGENLPGSPDYCAPVVVERLESIGLHFLWASSYSAVVGCHFVGREPGITATSQSRIEIQMFEGISHILTDRQPDGGSKRLNGFEVYHVEGLVGEYCLAQLNVSEAPTLFVSKKDFKRDESIEENCDAALGTAQLVRNLIF